MTLLLILFAGFMGTLAMTLFMSLISGLGVANADMIRAIGSLVTRKYETAFWPGVAFHFSAGCIFSLIYGLFGAVAPLPTHSGWSLVLTMTFLGTFHGLAMSIILAIEVAEYHPLPQFREAGLSVVIAHLLGHMVYGFFVGLIFAITRVNLPTILPH